MIGSYKHAIKYVAWNDIKVVSYAKNKSNV